MNAPRNPLTAHPITEVARAAGDVLVAQRRLVQAVRAARQFGCTWVAIGAHADRSEAWARRAHGGDAS